MRSTDREHWVMSQGKEAVLRPCCFDSSCPEMLPGSESLDDVHGGGW